MKLNWIASTTLSLLRAVESAGCPDVRLPLKDAGHLATVQQEAGRITDRLVSAAIIESVFWGHLIDEIVSCPNNPPLTPQLCEVALLRAGHSQLQSDQTAASIFRSIDLCRQSIEKDSPRLAEQLRLRYAPLKQAYEGYGPGMLRSIGNQIWNGSPPKDWWPSRATIHAVQPLRTGAAGRSTNQTSVWIEAVLTDISPLVPEWLRLVQQLTEMAIDTHTRTHASHFSVAGKDDAGRANAATTELPWSLGIVPMVLDQANERGFLSTTAEVSAAGSASKSTMSSSLPLSTALRLWQPSESDGDELVIVLEKWWMDVGSKAQAFPIALKQLADMLAASRHSSQSGAW